MIITVLFVGTYVVVFNVLGYGKNPSLVVSLVARVLRQISLMIVPATMAIAVLRYRLWDIDFAINRSLVYGSLTTILLTLFALRNYLKRQLGLNGDTKAERKQLAGVPDSFSLSSRNGPKGHDT